jgi:hypothetical protein
MNSATNTARDSRPGLTDGSRLKPTGTMFLAATNLDTMVCP